MAAPEVQMSTPERNGEILPPAMSAQDAEMARAAQRCIMLADDEGNQPVAQVPPQALKVIAQVLGAMSPQWRLSVQTHKVVGIA